MEEIQLKFVRIRNHSKGYLYCSGDDVSYSIGIHANKIESYDVQIKRIYRHLAHNLKLVLREVDTNFEVNNSQSEIDFLNYDLDNSSNGTIHFEYDVALYWFNSVENNVSEIILPRGCKISIFKNNQLDHPIYIVLRFYFNLFSNSLVSIETYGKREREMYYFEPAARINRAIVRNAILEVKLKYPEIEIEFNNEIGWLANFDEYGFTDETDFVFN